MTSYLDRISAALAELSKACVVAGLSGPTALVLKQGDLARWRALFSEIHRVPAPRWITESLLGIEIKEESGKVAYRTESLPAAPDARNAEGAKPPVLKSIGHTSNASGFTSVIVNGQSYAPEYVVAALVTPPQPARESAEALLAMAREALEEIATGRDKDGLKTDFPRDRARAVLAVLDAEERG